MTTNDLGEQIEQLMRAHIAAMRTAAIAAMDRALATVPRAETPTVLRSPRATRPTVSAGPRRAAEEVATLGERFYAVLCQNPGETMTTLAPQIGASPRMLHSAVAQLKRAGRVRSVGQRQHTRYFPMTSTAATA